MTNAVIIYMLLGCIIGGQCLVLRHKTPQVVRVREGSTLVLQAHVESEENNLRFYGPGNRQLGEFDHSADITREQSVIGLHIWRIDRHESGVYILKGFDVWNNEHLNWSVIVEVVPEYHVSSDTASKRCATVDNAERSCLTWEYHECDVVIRDSSSKILEEYNQCGELTKLKSEEREKLLVDAVNRGDNSKVQTLLLLGTRVNFNLYPEGSPLCAASRSGNVEMSLLFLNTGASIKRAITERFERLTVDVSVDVVPYFMSPIHCAALSGSIELVQIFLERGANINDGDNLYYRTPLLYAAMSGSVTLIEALSSWGVDQNIEDRIHRTPIHFAARSGSIFLVKYLVQSGADPLERDVIGNTPLFYAARSGSLSLVKYFIKLGVDPLDKDYLDFTPLFFAAESGSMELAQFLVSLGSDPLITNAIDESPIAYAARSGSLPMLEAFINWGAKITSKSKFGDSLLHIAAEKGHLSLVEKLIGESLNVTDPEEYGRTPLHLAASQGHLSVVQALINAGANLIRC
ncbi:serine/threonine-protein phosphatase 6 regulatory ankyrin repeat subunit A-like [Periplaneta americana]|uniref:serine/threonine-protein phosphatase 6 regulatory ankyrin repeat subunit A-like n=1 Tax=Periplaneta americana TaxID=6978 RepID=UPI0037E80A04